MCLCSHVFGCLLAAAACHCCLPLVPACQMILDKKFAGTLDQGAGCLEVFDAESKQGVYDNTLNIMDTLGSVVDTLFNRSQNALAAG